MTIDKDGLAPCPLCGVQYEQKPSAWPMDEPYAEHPRAGSPLEGHCILSGHMFALLPALVESWNRRALPYTGDELVARLRAGGDEPMPMDWSGRIKWLEANWALRLEAANAITSLIRTRDAARSNFLTMQGAAAELLKRAEAAEASLASAREALDWYADRVGLAGAMTAEGAKARAELTQDNGARALKEVR